MQAVGVDGDGGSGEDQRGSDDDDLAGSGDSDDSSDESPVVEGSLEDAKGLEDSLRPIEKPSDAYPIKKLKNHVLELTAYQSKLSAEKTTAAL